ncbi:hypothetical protein [Streptomyces sp. NPDC059134]|uniref:hypothetical protein n=1 Tax=Streptomyces sp. NPDC059134 TaxID=3346738 RepID=UPI00369032CA
MTVTDLDRNPAGGAAGTDGGPGAAPLRARPGLHYAPVAGGVYLSGTRGQFVLRGSDLLHAVADGCVPLLEAGTTEDALVAALGTERARPAVRHLLARLRENGLLLDPAAFTEPEPPAEVAARHADTLARLTARLDDPYAAFALLRRARVELRGPAGATGPALRGLRRAGVARVTTTPPAGGPGPTGPAPRPTPAGDPAVSEPQALTPVGDPTVTAPGGVPGEPDAVVVFLDGDATWTERDGTRHLPVLLGPGPLLVGPVGVTPAVWAAFRDRAGAWAAAEGVERPAGPVARALAGALAAQLLADTLTGVAEPGEAHVVHGPDLTADRVTVRGGPLTEAVAVRLGDTPAEPLPAPEDALDAAGVLTARWTGLFASAPGERLPQMPLALRAAEHRSGPTGTVTAWAVHQETATVAAALAALRDLARGPGASGTAAAGLTREHWLLDGALRELAERRGALCALPATGGPPHPEDRRVLAELRALLGPAAPELTLAGAAGVDWPLAEVTADGRRLGAGWGPTAADATHAALCTALAAVQSGGTADGLSTDALLTAGDAARAALRGQLTALAVHRGEPRRTDPVIGELPFWHGPVTARTRPTAPTASNAEEHTDAQT